MRCLIVLVVALLTTAHAADEDLIIARQALALARDGLSKDVESADALTWLNMAKALYPKSKDVQELENQRANERVLQPSSSPRLTNEKLFDALILRAGALMKKKFHNEVQLGYLANLYLRVAERKKAANLTLRKHIATLETYGIRESLKDALSRDYKLSTARKVGSKAVAQPVYPLRKLDNAIAYECVRNAAKLLSKDSKSERGRLWLDVGIHLRPDLITGIVIRDQLALGIPIKPLPGGVTDKKLIATMLDRAEYHQTKVKKSKVSAHLALLFYRLVERLDPTNRYALLGVIRLEKAGFDTSLKDLLADQTLAAVAGLEQLVVPEYVSKESATTTVVDPKEPNDPEDELPPDPVKWEKVKASGRIKKRDVMLDEFEEVESVSFEGVIENNSGALIAGAKVDYMLIGKNRSGKAMFIAKRLQAPIEKLESDGSIKLPKITATFGRGFRYLAWLVVIKNANGTVVKMQSLSSFVQKAADKMRKFPESPYYYDGTYGNTKSYFTNTGELIE